MRLLLPILLLFLGGCCAVTPAQSPSVTLAAQHPTVNLVGSGVPIGGGRVLTAAHVLPMSSGELEISGHLVPFQTVARGAFAGLPRLEGPLSEIAERLANDWTVIEIPGLLLEGPPPTFGAPAKPGECVTLDAGSVNGRVFLRGTAASPSGLSTALPNTLFLVRPEISTTDLDGASGGSVLNQRKEVVGILVASLETREGLLWVVRQTLDLAR